MVYSMPIFAEYRHVMYHWKALELIFGDLKRECTLIESALLLENLR